MFETAKITGSGTMVVEIMTSELGEAGMCHDSCRFRKARALDHLA